VVRQSPTTCLPCPTRTARPTSTNTITPKSTPGCPSPPPCQCLATPPPHSTSTTAQAARLDLAKVAEDRLRQIISEAVGGQNSSTREIVDEAVAKIKSSLAGIKEVSAGFGYAWTIFLGILAAVSCVLNLVMGTKLHVTLAQMLATKVALELTQKGAEEQARRDNSHVVDLRAVLRLEGSSNPTPRDLNANLLQVPSPLNPRGGRRSRSRSRNRVKPNEVTPSAAAELVDKPQEPPSIDLFGMGSYIAPPAIGDAAAASAHQEKGEKDKKDGDDRTWTATFSSSDSAC
jgi:hypothetical protein